MLPESDCRALAISMDALLKDFEPKEAVPYMEAEDFFSEDHVEALERLERRTLRVQQFLRVYRQKAETLEPLLHFFKENKQLHLANLIERNRVVKAEDRPLLSTERFTSRLLESGIPIRCRDYVERESLLLSLKKSLVNLANEDHFWLVVHGMAGAGKSCLAADVFTTFPELLSRYYEDVIWLAGDSCVTLDGLPSFYANFFTAIGDAVVLTGHEQAPQLQVQARLALLEKPNVLIILDNVIFEECVRWFDQLRCRILATTRNIDIFQAANSKVVFFPMAPSGFTLEELSKFVSSACFPKAAPSLVKNEFFKRFYASTKGLPALVNIMTVLSRNDPDRLNWLCSRLETGSLKSLDCITCYRYQNLDLAIRQSFDLLSSAQKNVLYSLGIFPTDTWIPVQVIDFIAPVDVAGSQDSVYETLQILEKLAQRSMIEERKVLEEDGCLYEYQLHPIIGNFLSHCVYNEYLCRTGFLIARMETFLQVNTRKKGYQKVYSFYKFFKNWLETKDFSLDEVVHFERETTVPASKKNMIFEEKRRLRESCLFM